MRVVVVSILGVLSSTLSAAAAPAITGFSPTGGPAGTAVTITGSGFTGATAVKFHGTAATFTQNSDTKITTKIPAAATTGVITVTAGGATAKSASSFLVSAGAGVLPASGRPLLKVTVSGTAFDPGTSIDVFFDTQDLALAVADASGHVSINLQIPGGAPPGVNWITLDERGTHRAAQKAFTVTTPWAMFGFGPGSRGYNPYENTIGSGNVSGLTTAWSGPAGGFSNASPFVVGSNVYVGDATGYIHAYGSSGKLVWNAHPGSDLESVTPVLANGRVFFGDASGNVTAYRTACRKDGGVCSAEWTQNVGSAVGGLTLFKGTLYASSSDGTIHPLNAVTGTQGTPIYGFDTIHGAVISPAAFTQDGTLYYATSGDTIQSRDAFGGSTEVFFAYPVSAPAAYNNAAYYTSGDGYLHQLGGASWFTATSTGGCVPAPAVANNVIYAGGCSTLGAYDAATGQPLWVVTALGQVLGVSVANGVVYTCEYMGGAGRLSAYVASYGARLWLGGYCTGAPEIADGMVYASYALMYAYALPASGANRVTPKPDPLTLKRNYALKAKARP